MRPSIRCLVIVSTSILVPSAATPLRGHTIDTVSPPASSTADPMAALLASRGLESTTNPVAASFLLDEGGRLIPDATRQEALGQVKSALIVQTDAMKAMMEGMAGMMGSDSIQKMMAAAGKAMSPGALAGNQIKSKLGLTPSMPGANVDPAQMQREMTEALTDPWIRGLEAASALERMGEPKAAASFYVNCFQFLPEEWVPEACLDQLVAMGPTRANILLRWMLDDAEKISMTASMMQMERMGGMEGMEEPGRKEKDAPPDPATIQIRRAALKGLGEISADPGLPQTDRASAFESVMSYAEGRQNAAYFAAAAEGLGRSRNPRAVEPLRRLAKERKAPGVRQAALTGLATGFGDRGAIKELRAQLEDDDPAVARGAARTLFTVGDDETYEWAVKVIKDRRTSEETSPDLRPEVVRDLVEAGGDKAKRALARALDQGPGNDWLKAWVAIGLLEMGDLSQLDLVKAAVARDDWTLDRRGFMSIFRQILNLAQQVAMKPSAVQAAKMAYNFAAAERQRFMQKAGKRETAIARLRWQAADAIGAADPPGGPAILNRLLDDGKPAVRISAAMALARSQRSDAVEGLTRASKADFGDEKGVSRSPEVRATVLRAAARSFGKDPRTQTLLKEAAASDDPVIRLIAIASLGSASSSAE